MGPVVLIVLGGIFLLNTMGVFRFDQIVRWWPVGLIVLGAYMLYCRIAGANERAAHTQEARDAHQ